VEVRPTRRPSLARLARENAAEGCVRETYGALLATWQAAHAADPEIRAAMGGIAEDETRHAELSWAIHAWATDRLPARERARVERARREAEEALLREVAEAPSAEVARDAGIPTGPVAAALARSLMAALRGSARSIDDA
jgi:hypothetical protein